MSFDGRYAVRGFRGVAFYVLGYATEDVYSGDVLVCEDEKCDHYDPACSAEGEWEEVESDSIVRAVMVGDDMVHLVDVDDLTPLEDEDYCHECGQIGCKGDRMGETER